MHKSISLKKFQTVLNSGTTFLGMLCRYSSTEMLQTTEKHFRLPLILQQIKLESKGIWNACTPRGIDVIKHINQLAAGTTEL